MKRNKNFKVKDRYDGVVFGNAIRYNTLRVNVEDRSEIMDKSSALSLASNMELELVLINEKSDPPVAKILDLNKFLYEKKQRQKQAEKKARESQVETKEIRMGLNIGDGDIDVKVKNIRKMLDKGCVVTLTIQLRGRERGKQNLAYELLDKFADKLSVELDKPSLAGNRISAKIKG